MLPLTTAHLVSGVCERVSHGNYWCLLSGRSSRCAGGQLAPDSNVRPVVRAMESVISRATDASLRAEFIECTAILIMALAEAEAHDAVRAMFGAYKSLFITLSDGMKRPATPLELASHLTFISGLNST